MQSLPGRLRIALPLLLLAGCVPSGNRAPPAADRPPPINVAGLESVIGANQRALVTQLGPVALDIHEGEARKLQFDAETGKEDERYLNHACDAFLYITRAFFPMYRPERLPPAKNTPEALMLEMKRERQSKIDEREKRLRRD